ncbi:MAG: hypothetical protein GY789_27835 [Hyphomicrobiales bacterium]|nr:hypothetical protein [Hyphomicrobiales bacterium]
MDSKKYAIMLMVAVLTCGVFMGLPSADDTKSNVVKQVNVPRKVIPRSVGTFAPYNYTEETDQEFLKDASAAASNDRISVTLYGGNGNVKGAVQHAAKHFAHNVHDVSYIEAPDNDVNPNDSWAAVYAEGRLYDEVKIGNNTSQKEIARTLYKMMLGAHKRDIEPYYAVSGEKEETETQAKKNKEGGE